jgi:hypothetical protein
MRAEISPTPMPARQKRSSKIKCGTVTKSLHHKENQEGNIIEEVNTIVYWNLFYA